MPSFGTDNKSYVSALTVGNIVDRREIMNQILNVTNEDTTFVELMELMGRMEPTQAIEYYNGVNEELSVNVTATAVDNATYSTARPLITLSAGDYALVREGETVIFPNQQIGWIKSKASYGSVTLSSNQIEVLSVTGNSLAAAVGQKLAVFSNLAGEGTGAPTPRRYAVSVERNNIQIIKEAYSVTDVSSMAFSEFEYNGQPYYFRHEMAQVLAKFQQAVSMGLFFNRLSVDTFNDPITGTTLTTKNGEIVSSSRGVHEYCEQGIQFPSVGINTSSFADVARAFAKARCPMNYMILHGTEPAIAFDNMLNALTSAAVSQNSFVSVDPNADNINFGTKDFKLYGYNYTRKKLASLDHRNLIYFDNSAGFQNNAYLLPMDNIKTTDGGLKPRFQMRYMPWNVRAQVNSSVDQNGLYRELMTGGLADGVATDTNSLLNVTYESRVGMHCLGVQHFGILKLA